jgi:hypothetical protein
VRNLERSFAALAFLMSGNVWAEDTNPTPTEPPPPAPAAEPAPAVEEVKALEVDIEAAKEKVEELKGFEQVDGAAPNTAAPAVAVSEAVADTQAFTVRLVTGLSVGTGGFMENETLAETSNYVAQGWDLRPGYKFEAFGHKLKVSGRLLLDTEYTTPNNSTGRAWTPSDASVSLADAEIYKEAITDIKLSGSVGWLIPLSYESLNVTKRWGGLSMGLTLDRSIGPVDISYSLGFRKFFNSSYVAVRSADPASASSKNPIRSQGETDVQTEEGATNTSFDLRNTIEVAYNVTEQLSVAYSLMFWNSWKYNVYPEADQYTNQNADVGRERGKDQLWPTLEVGYDATSLLKTVVDVPVEIALAAGITALHPAQYDGNRKIMWPTFYHSMANNQAANNYGTVYFQIDGTY